MRKKIGIRTLAVFMVLLLSGGMIGSAYAAVGSINASYYLDDYAATADTGTSGEVVISFDVNATRVMDSVGASYIVIQENNSGVWKGVASYFGSTANGMLAADTDSHMGSIAYVGTLGKQYRALVTVYAGNSTGSDSRTVTTDSVTAG